MKAITIHTQKGGGGKTTLSAHLAAQAAKDGRRVLLVDLDPQKSLEAWWSRRAADDILLARAPDPKAIRAVAAEHGCDLVIIDTQPRSSALTLAALALADTVLVPCCPSIVDIDVLPTVAELLARARVTDRHHVVLNRCPAPRGVLKGEPSVVSDSRTAVRGLGLMTAIPYICDRAAFRHAMNDGRAVIDFEPEGKAAEEIAALWEMVK